MTGNNASTLEYKTLVERGYDVCATAYESIRQVEADSTLGMLMDQLDDGAKVLDLGCGAGVPVARELAERFKVQGVDISGVMIDRAKTNVPSGNFIHSDMMSVKLPSSHFDGVVAYYSIFHLPREEHEQLFNRIHQWLKPGGYLLATVGMKGQLGYTNDDFLGVRMYWSHFGLSESMVMMDLAGFKVLAVSIIGHGYDEKHQKPEERHPLIFAQKK